MLLTMTRQALYSRENCFCGPYSVHFTLRYRIFFYGSLSAFGRPFWVLWRSGPSCLREDIRVPCSIFKSNS